MEDTGDTGDTRETQGFFTIAFTHRILTIASTQGVFTIATIGDTQKTMGRDSL
jgi:hypothetical protein